MGALMQLESWTILGSLAAVTAMKNIELYDFPANNCKSIDQLSTGTADETKTKTEAESTWAGSSPFSFISSLLGAPVSIADGAAADDDDDDISDEMPPLKSDKDKDEDKNEDEGKDDVPLDDESSDESSDATVGPDDR